MSAAPADRPRPRGMFSRFGPARRPPSRLRRRLAAGARLVAALTLVGGLYTAFAPAAVAEDSSGLSPAAQQGKGYFDQTCASCHGSNAQGVPGKGPSLIGVDLADVMRRNIPVVTTGTRFEEAFRIMQECNCPAVPVLDGARRLVGLLTPENVTELMMVQSALPRRRFA